MLGVGPRLSGPWPSRLGLCGHPPQGPGRHFSNAARRWRHQPVPGVRLRGRDPARHGVRLYATEAELAGLAERGHSRGLPIPCDEPAAIDEQLLAAFTRREAKVFASRTDLDADTVDRLARRDLADLERDLARATRSSRPAAAAGPVGPQGPAGPTSSAKPPNRDGGCEHWTAKTLGSIVAVDDHAGTVDVLLTNDQGRSAERTFAWHDLVVIDRPQPVPLTEPARATLARIGAELAAQEARWAGYLAGFGLRPGDRDRLGGAVDAARDRAGRQLRSDPPHWPARWIRARPGDGIGACVWDQAVDRIAVWRARHHIDATSPGLGERPEGVGGAWDREMSRLLEDRRWLEQRPARYARRVERPNGAGLDTGLGELEALMATAPPDQSRIIASLADGTVDNIELLARLAAAEARQGERRDWIVANWPYVVEYAEMQRLATRRPDRPAEVVQALTRIHDAAAHQR